jgi:hypothetical protein
MLGSGEAKGGEWQWQNAKRGLSSNGKAAAADRARHDANLTRFLAHGRFHLVCYWCPQQLSGRINRSEGSTVDRNTDEIALHPLKFLFHLNNNLPPWLSQTRY